MRIPPPSTATQTEFLSALAAWSGRPFDEFPNDAPPCGALGSLPEDRTLAAIFVGIASTTGPTALSDRMVRLHNLTVLHARHYQRALAADPYAVQLLADYGAMILVIHDWFQSLDATVGQVAA